MGGGWLGLELGDPREEGADFITPSVPNHESEKDKGFLVLPNSWVHNGYPPNFPLPLCYFSNR